MNTLKTGVLLAAIGGLAVGLGAYLFGANGAIIGLAIALLFQGVSYFQGHRMALMFARAQRLQPGELPWLEGAAAQLAQRAGIPVPGLYLSPDPQPNAFAAGRSPEVAVVCINEGLLRLMPRNEVIAVMAHEFGHIKNRDTLTMTVAAAMASFINFIAYFAYLIPIQGEGRGRNPLVSLALFILAPITATMIQLAISRTREYAADREAAELLRTPDPMIDALRSLERGTERIPTYTAQPATAHMYIASPFGGKGMSLFATHPPIADRIRKLAELRR